MSDTKTIEAEVVRSPHDSIDEIVPPITRAVAVREPAGAVARAMTIDELRANLDFVRDVMRNVMKEGQDYGKIPSCGDKPCLMQPGAQKLLMTFQLTDHVKKEVLREYPGWHREYEFTVCVRAQNGKEWDGVGTCSTLESKYRYRKAERRCPKCGTNHIIQGKAEFGGGWLCWKKKGGCGAKFNEDDKAITGQSSEDVENEDPADSWNTVRKMAFKRALVAAAINATNTSELWTQDLDERAPDAPGQAGSEPPPKHATQAGKRAATPQPATAPAANAPSVDKEAQRKADNLLKLEKLAGKPFFPELVRYFQNCPAPSGKLYLMPNEDLSDLPAPVTAALISHWDDALPKIEDWLKKNPKPQEPQATPAPPQKQQDPEWWRDVIVPVPHKGEKKVEYDKNPETIGQLYDAMKEGDQQAQSRLWGFANHYEPKGWTKKDGTQMPPNKHDKAFREALDAFVEWHEKYGKDTVQPSDPRGLERRMESGPIGDAARDACDRDIGQAEADEEDDVPF